MAFSLVNMHKNLMYVYRTAGVSHVHSHHTVINRSYFAGMLTARYIMRLRCKQFDWPTHITHIYVIPSLSMSSGSCSFRLLGKSFVLSPF